MYQCPVCGELLEALTNVHCLRRHHITRRELIADYGSPKFVTPKLTADIQKWLKNTQIITKTDFDMAQASARVIIGKKG